MIGELARKRGAESPGRLVASAKSWLSYAAVNRDGADSAVAGARRGQQTLSGGGLFALSAVPPHSMGRAACGDGKGHALAEQDVLLTVPASFDEEARELTRRAAEQAGLQRVTLLEEPQAAFYAWLESQGDGWRKRIKIGDLVLVCDVGGGTTDFSLITVSEENGDLALKRVAVGDHILLGGDNMDLALARLLQQKLEAAGHRIDTYQLQGLWYQCRSAKEHLFEHPKSQKQDVTLLGKGRKLVGGTIKTELLREDLNRVLVEGFFPKVASDRNAGRAAPDRISGIGPAVCRRCGSHEAPGALSVASSTEQSGSRQHSARPKRIGMSDACSVQWRSHEGGRAAQASGRGAQSAG